MAMHRIILTAVLMAFFQLALAAGPVNPAAPPATQVTNNAKNDSVDAVINAVVN